MKKVKRLRAENKHLINLLQHYRLLVYSKYGKISNNKVPSKFSDSYKLKSFHCLFGKFITEFYIIENDINLNRAEKDNKQAKLTKKYFNNYKNLDKKLSIY